MSAGLNASLGIATEASFNSYTAPTRFYEFNSESLNYVKNVQVGMGLRGGGVLPRSSRRVVTTVGASGDFTLDLPTVGLDTILLHAMGAQAGNVFTLGDPSTRSMTVQVGVPQYGGTVTPKTITGAKVTSFTLGVDNGGIATGSFSVDGAAFTTAQSLATPSYSTSASVFNFAQGAITVDGVAAANIRDFNVTVENTLNTERYNLGASGTKSAQVVNGFRAVTGSMTAEFTSTALLAKVLSDADASVSLTFTGPSSSSLTIALAAVKFDGDMPQVGGPETIDQAMTFTAYDNGSTPMTVTYVAAA